MGIHTPRRIKFDKSRPPNNEIQWKKEDRMYTRNGQANTQSVFYPVVGGIVNKESWITAKVSNSLRFCLTQRREIFVIQF